MTARRSAPVQVNLRLSEEQAAALDEWLDELNEGRVIKLSRSDVQRALLEWGLRVRPSFTRSGFNV